MKVWMALGILLLLPFAATRAGDWSDLWRRPDQQGEKALESGDPQRAASLYTDPRRQAYAQLKAGQYKEAAQKLAPLEDAQSQFNRGNALARGGDLSSALSAYEATLKHADLDTALRRDAIHNRDLVAQQLKSQNKPQQGGQSGQPSESDKQAGASDESSKSSSAQGSKNPAQSQQASEDAGRDAKKAENQPEKNSRPDSGEPTNASAAPNEPAAGKKSAAQEDSELGKERDAGKESDVVKGKESDVGKERDVGKESDVGKERDVGKESATANAIPTPQTEQQLALEQWLRQIPDDPGGLLRRKFLIEHLMKQQVQP